jgi:hypothetical protein
MNAFSNCALVFVEGSTVELPLGECDLDFDLEFDLCGGVGLLEGALVEPSLEADLPLLGGL